MKLVILLVILLLGGGGGGLSALLGGQSDAPTPPSSQQQVQNSGNTGSIGNTGSTNWAGLLSGLGGGKDTVTIMVYMCGTDLESRSGMGTADLQEMMAPDLTAISIS